MSKRDRYPEELPHLTDEQDRQVETHPAYGTITLGRTSQGPEGARLFYSDFRHRHYVTLEISTAERHRNLSNDWLHPRKELIRVAMSEAQFGSFVSSAGVGEGTPCTIQRIGHESIPDIASLVDLRRQFQDELGSRLDQVVAGLANLTAQIEAAPLSGTRKEALRGLVDSVRRNLGENLSFVASQFDEHLEATVERAKSEVAAYAQRVVQKAGLESLGADAPRLLLGEGVDRGTDL